MKKIVYLFAFLLTLSACSSIDCPLNSRVYATYTFKNADATTDTLEDTLTVRAIREENDTLLFNKGVGISTFKIPLSYFRKEDVLGLRFADTYGNVTYDTIWIEKENYPHMESVDCAPKYFHTITNVRSTRNRIDRIVLNEKEVEYDTSAEIFHIYLYPDF
jgi:hypothetical protein